METAKKQISNTPELLNVNTLVGSGSGKQSTILKNFILSDWAKMLFTFILLLTLFAITFFLSYISSQRRLNKAEDVVPEAEIILPQNSPSPTQQGISTENSNASGECMISGCNSELCQEADDEPLSSTCVYRSEYACYQSAVCEKQEDGKCGWTQTEELQSCLSKY